MILKLLKKLLVSGILSPLNAATGDYCYANLSCKDVSSNIQYDQTCLNQCQSGKNSQNKYPPAYTISDASDCDANACCNFPQSSVTNTGLGDPHLVHYYIDPRYYLQKTNFGGCGSGDLFIQSGWNSECCGSVFRNCYWINYRSTVTGAGGVGDVTSSRDTLHPQTLGMKQLVSLGSHCGVTTKLSTFDPTALDKNVPIVFKYLYGPFQYTAEQVRQDILNKKSSFVAYTHRSVKITFDIKATQVCAGTNLDWNSDYWYRQSLYIESSDLYYKQQAAGHIQTKCKYSSTTCGFSGFPSILKLGETYPRFVTDYGETCYFEWLGSITQTSCTKANAQARSPAVKAQFAGYYFREWKYGDGSSPLNINDADTADAASQAVNQCYPHYYAVESCNPMSGAIVKQSATGYSMPGSDIAGNEKVQMAGTPSTNRAGTWSAGNYPYTTNAVPTFTEMNDGAPPSISTPAVTNSFWNKNFVSYNQLEYPNFDNSALIFGYDLKYHYFIPNAYNLKGEYDLYIYARDNSAAHSSTCTQNLYKPDGSQQYIQNQKFGKQILHVCGPTSSVITERPEDLDITYDYPSYGALYRDKVNGHNVNLVGQTVLPYIYKKEIYVFSQNPTTQAGLYNYFPFRDMENTDHPYCQNFIRQACLYNYDPCVALSAPGNIENLPTTNVGTTHTGAEAPILVPSGWPSDGTACQDYGNCQYKFRIIDSKTVGTWRFYIRTVARGSDIAYSDTPHIYHQVCGPDSTTIQYVTNSMTLTSGTGGNSYQYQTAIAKDINIATEIKFYFPHMTGNNDQCTTYTVRQTYNNPPVFLDQTNSLLTEYPVSESSTLQSFSVVDNTMPQVISFYIVAREAGGSLFPTLTAQLVKITITCSTTSTTMTKPSLLPLTAGTDYHDMTENVSRIYEIYNFYVSNLNCGITTNAIVVASPALGTMDQYLTTGVTSSTSVTMLTSPSNSKIQLQIPPITVVEHFYYFRLHATANGGTNKYSDNIKIRLVNCAYTSLSLVEPYPTPVPYYALDVTSTSELTYIFKQTTSDFIECRDITMKQTDGLTLPLTWPGTPSTKLTTTDAILSGNQGSYNVVDKHKPQVIKFFIISKESRGVELLTATEITLDITCGLTSTTIVAPDILPQTTNGHYLMRGLDVTYHLPTAFTNSNEDNCPVTSFGIVAILGGTDPTDWLGTKATELVTLVTKVPSNTYTQLTVPLIEADFKFFNFRLQTSATGGSQEFTQNIKIKRVNCDWTKVTTNPFQVVDYNVTQNSTETFILDINSAFSEILSECPIRIIYVDKVIVNETGSAMSQMQYHFDMVDGVITTSTFPDPMEKINLYVRASAAETLVVPSDPVFVCTLTVNPLPPIPINIPPTFELPLIPKHFNFTNKDNSDETSKGFTFPKVMDSEGESVDVAITGGLKDFMHFDNKTGKLVTKPTKPDEFGTFFITIQLTDKRGASRNYVQTIILTAPEPVPEVEPNKTGPIIKNIYNTNYIEYDTPDKTLKAAITEIDKYGVVHIEYRSLKNNKVAFLDSTIFADPTPLSKDLSQIIKVNRRELITKYNYYENTIRYKTRNTTSLNEMDTLLDLNTTQLDMYIVPQNDGQYEGKYNYSKLNFTWEIIRFDLEWVNVQLKFLDPNYISAGIKWDQYLFHVKPKYSYIFYSANDATKGEIDPAYYTLTHELPPQLGYSSYDTEIINIAYGIKYGLLAVLWSMVVSSLFLGGNLRWYFGFMRTFQMIINLPMLHIVVPTSVIYFYSIVMPIAKWDIFEGFNFGKNRNLEVYSNDEKQAKFAIFQQMQLLGYDSSSIWQNLGSIMIFVFFYCGEIVVLAALKCTRLSYGNQQRCEKLYKHLLQNLFFFEFWMIVLEPYIVFLVSGFLQYEKLDGFTDRDNEQYPKVDPFIQWEREWAIFNYKNTRGIRRQLHKHIIGPVAFTFKNMSGDEFLACCLMFICLVLAPLQFLYYWKNHINIHQKLKFNNRIGSIFQDIEMRSPWPAAFYLMYIARRILFVWIVFNLEEYSGVQLLILNMMNLLILIYVAGSNPLQEKFRNRLEIFNELFVCYCTQHMYFYTDWVLDKNQYLTEAANVDENTQYWYGVLHNCFFGYYIYANIAIMLWVSLKRFYLFFIWVYKKCKYHGWGQGKPHHPQYIIEDPLDKIMKTQVKLNVKNLIEPHFEAVKEKYEPVLSVVIEEETVQEETPPQEVEPSESSQDNKGLNFAEFMDQLRTKPEVPAQQNFADFMDKMRTEEVEPEVREANIQTTLVQDERVNFADYMDKMNSEEIVIKNTVVKEESGGGFAQFMDNMESELTVANVHETEVRNSGNGKINFADYMDNMNSKYDNTNEQITSNARQVVKINDLENANRITGQGKTITNVIVEKKTGDSQAGKYNFGAFMDQMDSEEPPEIIFNKEEGGNAKFSGKISVDDNRSSVQAQSTVAPGQRVGNYFGAGKGEVGGLLQSFTAKKNQLQELVKSKDGKSRGGSSYIQKRVTPGPAEKEGPKAPAYDFAAFMDNLDSKKDKNSEKAQNVATPPESPYFYQSHRGFFEKDKGGQEKETGRTSSLDDDEKKDKSALDTSALNQSAINKLLE